MTPLDTVCELVYDYLWQYLVIYEKLPVQRNLAPALSLTHAQVSAALAVLRREGKLKGLYPVAYDTYWRNHIRSVLPTVPSMLPVAARG